MVERMFTRQGGVMTSTMSALQLRFPIDPKGELRRAPRRPPTRPVPMATHGLLEQARQGLGHAMHATKPVDRFCGAYLAALRGAAAVVAARAEPRRHPRPTSVWFLLSAVCPELREWSEFFKSRSGMRAAAEAGVTRLISHHEGEDLVRQTEQFLSVVEHVLWTPRP